MTGSSLSPGDPLGAAPTTPQYGGGPVPPGAYAPRPERPAPPRQDELAEWWRRALAAVVDGVILSVLTIAILAGLGAGLFAGGELGAVEIVLGTILAVVVFAALALLYAPAVMVWTNGQTLGKMLAGCRVVRADGKRVSFWWAALREVAIKGLVVGIASAITGGLAYLADGLWPLVDGQNRALHDFVVDSRVVRTG